ASVSLGGEHPECNHVICDEVPHWKDMVHRFRRSRRTGLKRNADQLVDSIVYFGAAVAATHEADHIQVMPLSCCEGRPLDDAEAFPYSFHNSSLHILRKLDHILVAQFVDLTIIHAEQIFEHICGVLSKFGTQVADLAG